MLLVFSRIREFENFLSIDMHCGAKFSNSLILDFFKHCVLMFSGIVDALMKSSGGCPGHPPFSFDYSDNRMLTTSCLLMCVMS